jgi:DNA-binding beta-propeller fold protein YncE
MKTVVVMLMMTALMTSLVPPAQSTEPLKLAAKYNLPETVTGRFDHLSADLNSNRLFLTAESAHEVLVFNLRNGKFIRTIPDIGIPHAVFIRDDLDRIFVTDGGAGEVKVFDGKSYALLGSAKLKVDADSIGYDLATRYLYVDNGGGDAHESFSMLSVVDTTSGKKIADMQIEGETLEAMALSHSSPTMYVNNARKNLVDVVNRQTRSVVATWPVTMGKRNVAMALDEATNRLFVACRSGAIVVIDTKTGKELQSLTIGPGVDDLIFDAASKRLYAACGGSGGSLAVYHEDDPDRYTLLGQVPSAPGGKNEVLVPKLGRLFITIPPRGETPGQIYVYKVQ